MSPHLDISQLNLSHPDIASYSSDELIYLFMEYYQSLRVLYSGPIIAVLLPSPPPAISLLLARLLGIFVAETKQNKLLSYKIC